MELPSVRDNPVFYLGIVVTIEQAIAGGTIHLTNVIPEGWIPYATGWAALLGFVGTTIMTALSAPGIARQAVAPATKAILIALTTGLLWAAMAPSAHAQDRNGGAPRKIGGPIGHVLDDIQNQTPAQEDKLGKLLSKPFTDLADFINSDAAEAAKLATAIPTLQDGHGQQCWMAMGEFTAVLKAHPVPLTFHAATDLEALRLANIAANRLCANVHCTQVFSDLSNAVQQTAGQVGGALVSGGLQIPSLNTLCSKVPQVAVVAPITPIPTPAPTSTPAPSTPNP